MPPPRKSESAKAAIVATKNAKRRKRGRSLFSHFLRLFAFFAAITFALLPAHAATNSVHLRWDANTETNVAGYHLLYGQSSQVYTRTNVILGRLNTNEIISNLPVGDWYFVATAVASNGLESAYSWELMWDNTPPPVAPSPPKNLTLVATVQAAASTNGPWKDLARVTVPAPALSAPQFYRGLLTMEEGPP